MLSVTISGLCEIGSFIGTSSARENLCVELRTRIDEFLRVLNLTPHISVVCQVTGGMSPREINIQLSLPARVGVDCQVKDKLCQIVQNIVDVYLHQHRADVGSITGMEIITSYLDPAQVALVRTECNFS